MERAKDANTIVECFGHELRIRHELTHLSGHKVKHSDDTLKLSVSSVFLSFVEDIPDEGLVLGG
jgi:hypothetical protein